MGKRRQPGRWPASSIVFHPERISAGRYDENKKPRGWQGFLKQVVLLENFLVDRDVHLYFIVVGFPALYAAGGGKSRTRNHQLVVVGIGCFKFHFFAVDVALADGFVQAVIGLTNIGTWLRYRF